MGLLEVILVLLLIGVVLSLINWYAPPYVDGKMIHLINIVVVIAVVLWLLRVFGVFSHLHDIRVGSFSYPLMP